MSQNHSASGNTITASETQATSRVNCVIIGCEKTFSREHDMRRHCESVHDQMRYPCLVCGRKLYRKDKLLAHERDKHSQISNEHSTEPYRDQHIPGQNFPARFITNPITAGRFADLKDILPELFSEYIPAQHNSARGG
ncbi:hypothetical protein BGZ57DRAFT_910300 [Hyaloscypha finlandica]|nr:hypothetical protein BGZ57DRAFT_910300 [Hyaloscypha finlandica]